jgi:hypothetical protein
MSLSKSCGVLALLLTVSIYSANAWFLGRRNLRGSRAVRRVVLNAKPPPSRPTSSGFSYVEEGEYASAEEEIDAMGGDSFFLEDQDANATSSTQESNSEEDVDAVWEWDGVVDEDAHMD